MAPFDADAWTRFGQRDAVAHDGEIPMQLLTPEADRVPLPEPVRIVCQLTGRVHLVRRRVGESADAFEFRARRIDTVLHNARDLAAVDYDHPWIDSDLYEGAVLARGESPLW